MSAFRAAEGKKPVTNPDDNCWPVPIKIGTALGASTFHDDFTV
jgi:hypothetical protein